MKEWNKRFSETDVTLFPQESQLPKGISTNYDLTDFQSEVESEKLDLERTKLHWEEKYSELQKQGEMERISKLRLSQKTAPQQDSSKYIMTETSHVNSNNQSQYRTDPTNESAIEREIRLAQEREAELRRDHSLVGNQQSPSSGFHDLTEADQGSELMKRSIIENEIQVQQLREKAYHQELPQHRVNRNKVRRKWTWIGRVAERGIR